MGEPAGVGGELALKAWIAAQSSRSDDVPLYGAFFVIDDPERLRRLSAIEECSAPIAPIRHVSDCIDAFSEGLPVLPLPAAVRAEAGRPDLSTASAVVQSIDTGLDLVTGGDAAALVTNPIQKAPLMAAGFGFPGHTEYLQDRAGGSVVMMLASPKLRVSLVTIHLPLSEVPRALTTAKIVSTGRITAAALQQDFGVAKPRLAVSGLNPHAGEAGALGHEEKTVIGPAIDALRADGIAVSGPHPADTLFHDAARTTYDAAICMYHDQGLAPLKAIDFSAVNITLGLPFIRTSPDHGTALDLAGTGEADPASLLAALAMARQMADRRAAPQASS